jgi:protein required for attachment to host cells
MNTWILISDASRARIFSFTDPEGGWELVRELNHPQSRANDRDLDSSELGRTRQVFGQGSRSAMEPPTTPKEHEAEQFAHELVHLLDHEYDRQAYTDLILAAPPHFLGMLRGRLPAKLTRHIIEALDKDYTMLSQRELEANLGAKLKVV